MYESDNILIHMFDNYTASKSKIMIYKGEYARKWDIEVTLVPDDKSGDEIKLRVQEADSLVDALAQMQAKLEATLPNNRRFDPNKALEYSDVASGDTEAQNIISDEEIPF